LLESLTRIVGRPDAGRTSRFTPRPVTFSVVVIRLLELLLHGGTHVGGWTAKDIHQSVLTTFGLSERSYGLNQLRYDLRKLRGHGFWAR
jgi:hypothetical protein